MGLDAPVNPRFGRCPYYVIVETETMESEAISNTGMNAPSGAGIGAAQLVAEKGVEAVLTGSVGPKATQVLSRASIKILTGAGGSIRQTVEAYKRGELEASPTAGYGGFYGGRGGRGMGRGMVRGMGMGGERGMYQYQPIATQPRQMNREEERDALQGQLEQLEGQLKDVKKRLEEFDRCPH
jgi:predicted Fe-Mo cluster-binding NifX family protein